MKQPAVVRVWRASATAAGLQRYLAHFRSHVSQQLRDIDGFLGARVLVNKAGSAHEIVVETTWDSMSSIRRFAGDRPELAVVEEDAMKVLTSFEKRVTHYEVTNELSPAAVKNGSGP